MRHSNQKCWAQLTGCSWYEWNHVTSGKKENKGISQSAERCFLSCFQTWTSENVWAFVFYIWKAEQEIFCIRRVHNNRKMTGTFRWGTAPEKITSVESHYQEVSNLFVFPSWHHRLLLRVWHLFNLFVRNMRETSSGHFPVVFSHWLTRDILRGGSQEKSIWQFMSESSLRYLMFKSVNKPH